MQLPSVTARFAIYLPPPHQSPLEDFARRWLGRDHVSGDEPELMGLPGLSKDRQKEITASPRHYGFHATLKAPFELAATRTLDELERAGLDFARKRAPFALRLDVQSLNGFIALVPALPSPAVDQLAASCVREFEPFRAPLRPGDIERRRKSGLSQRQDAQMLEWGYPYIFDDFRFHMTLTQHLERSEQSDVLRSLKPAMTRITGKPLIIEEIAIYAQSDREAPFLLHRRLPFGKVR